MLHISNLHPKKHQQLPGTKALAGSSTSAIRIGFHQVKKSQEKNKKQKIAAYKINRAVKVVELIFENQNIIRHWE